jgi:NADPH:quinone reductase-like Zn-dependent oxidoreductase
MVGEIFGPLGCRVLDKHAMVRRFREHWLERFEGGAGIEPVVDSTFPLARAADAHRRMEASVNVGKIILKMTKNACVDTR